MILNLSCYNWEDSNTILNKCLEAVHKQHLIEKLHIIYDQVCAEFERWHQTVILRALCFKMISTSLHSTLTWFYNLRQLPTYLRTNLALSEMLGGMAVDMLNRMLSRMLGGMLGGMLSGMLSRILSWMLNWMFVLILRSCDQRNFEPIRSWLGIFLNFWAPNRAYIYR